MKRITLEEASKIYPNSWILFTHYDIDGDEKGEVYKVSENCNELINEFKKLLNSELKLGEYGLFSTQKEPENVWIGIFEKYC